MLDVHLARLDACNRLSREEAFKLCSANGSDLEQLMALASKRRDRAHGNLISYSRKVFIPLTQLCRDVCHYCTFAHAPKKDQKAFLSLDEVLVIARKGAAAGCKEALFTLGDKPELRYSAARDQLKCLGFETTIDYLEHAAEVVIEETGLLPHINAGIMGKGEIERLRRVSISQGIMLETASDRLSMRGFPHFGSPDKIPAARLEMIEAAGVARVPFTTGILIGIGETREERVEALLAIRDLQDRFGHIQEIIIQNFLPKPGTRMAAVAPVELEEHLWTIAIARQLFAPEMNIQAPPNLAAGPLEKLIAAGVNDWGGVSPVTPDHVNPEAPWPHVEILQAATAASGKCLTERLAIYPDKVREVDLWADAEVRSRTLKAVDAAGWPRTDNWFAGREQDLPATDVENLRAPKGVASRFGGLLSRLQAGSPASESELASLFEARGADFASVCAAAAEICADLHGDRATFVVTRNINYTNICGFKCGFCAFSKGSTADHLRGKPYDLSLGDVAQRVREASQRGATEVCMQGGIHPRFSGKTYLELCASARQAAPDIHIHAFSPLEVTHGAQTLDLSLEEFLEALKAEGLNSLPGTAAEVLDDEVRAVICPDKIKTDGWLAVMRAAHRVGLRSTATIMFGHVDGYAHWARHLLHIRELQHDTGGFTEFVPLPFVHMESPIFRRGISRAGPTFREAVLMHAVSRLALNPVVPNIQTSWVKMGPNGAAACLKAGANDLGGTLMNESITRAAGAQHGQEMTIAALQAIAEEGGKQLVQRSTLYRLLESPPDACELSCAARP